MTPEARFVVLREPRDLDQIAADARPGMVFAVLSCNVAKLGHAWEGATADAMVSTKDPARRENRCPRCNAPVRHELRARRVARTRACCTSVPWVPANGLAVVARDLATALVPIVPRSAAVLEAASGRIAQLLGDKLLACCIGGSAPRP